MDLGLKNKIAIVAASTKGLGKATAIALASEGADVIINGRHKQNIHDAVDEIKSKTGKSPLAIQCDLTQSEDIDRLFDEAVKHFGTIHILVSNAGGPPAGGFNDFNDEQWLKAVDLSLMSAVRLIRKVVPIMQKEKWGRIVNVSSITVKQPAENLILSNSIRLRSWDLRRQSHAIFRAIMCSSTTLHHITSRQRESITCWKKLPPRKGSPKKLLYKIS